MRTSPKPPVQRTIQLFAMDLKPGDLVALATQYTQNVGVFKGWSKGGNCQVELPGISGTTYVKTCISTHNTRIVKVRIEDLPANRQQEFQNMSLKYQVHETIHG